VVRVNNEIPLHAQHQRQLSGQVGNKPKVRARYWVNLHIWKARMSAKALVIVLRQEMGSRKRKYRSSRTAGISKQQRGMFAQIQLQRNTWLVSIIARVDYKVKRVPLHARS
jgi:hypothetical protein